MLCDSFKRLALETWDKIKEGRQIGFQFQEETITDINIFNLKLRNSGQVFTKEFTKRAEGRNGADWEWWFNYKKLFIGFRVQAKIIAIQNDGFEHLHYHKNIKDEKGNIIDKIYQSDKLIKNALSKTTPKFPLYCFYIHTEDKGRLKKWSCGSYSSVKDLWGCSLISAFDVIKLRNGNKRHIEDLEEKMNPWHCLVCCKGYDISNPIHSIYTYANEKFNLDNEIAKNIGVTIPNSFITETPPDYVFSMRRNEGNFNIQPPDNELYGVALFLLNDNF